MIGVSPIMKIPNTADDVYTKMATVDFIAQLIESRRRLRPGGVEANRILALRNSALLSPQD